MPFSSEAITASDSRRTPAARTSAEMLRGKGSNTDAGRLDGNDFGDGRSVETAAEFTPDLIQQRHIHLVVERAVHLEYAAFFHLPVPQDPLF